MYSVYVFNKQKALWDMIPRTGSQDRDDAIRQAANLASVDIRSIQKTGRRAYVESICFDDMIAFKVINGKYQIEARYGVYKKIDPCIA